MPYRAAWLAARRSRPKLAMVIFDCDGVLVDSEAICNRIVADELTALGWAMTAHEAEERFIGQSFHDMRPIIEDRLRRPLETSWIDTLVTRISDAMTTEVELVPGALEALRATTALGLPWRIASNSSHAEMAAKFARTGLAEIAVGRAHSGHDIVLSGGRGKPEPDVYLEAAAAEGIDPAACLAIEDSATGARAAVAAGMDCLGLVPPHREDAIRAVGATPIASMRDLPALLRLALAP
jgi:beta-phosphoglucomutase-like phosphatase (HAD superfamily)